jgi:hypothetical protein
MIKIENIEVYNIVRAVYSARNALNSWDKSDSDFEHDILGKNDLNLAKKLYKAGTEHRKYLRQIFVSIDITAPLYWWKEADQYRINVTTNSCSTMHKIAAKEFEFDDFSHEHLTVESEKSLLNTIDVLNRYRNDYISLNNDKEMWWQMIQLLPSSYNQKRTITMNYENVVTIIRQRTGHKLDEWNDLVSVLKDLPYVKEIIDSV